MSEQPSIDNQEKEKGSKRKGVIALVINVGIMGAIAVVALWILFGMYLPSYTNHGETIEVPNLMKMSKTELKKAIEDNDLRYTIVDSTTYEKGMPPGVVVSQRPVAGTLVKENRKIYININASDVPMVNVPIKQVVGETSSNARSALVDSLGFIIDSVKYRISLEEDMVLGVIYNEEEIKEDVELPKNSMLVLVVGRKGASRKVGVPDVVGMPLGIAMRMVQNAGLRNTMPIFNASRTENPGQVYKQSLEPGDSVQAGEYIDLFYEGPELNVGDGSQPVEVDTTK